jgi:hypothetical protein
MSVEIRVTYEMIDSFILGTGYDQFFFSTVFLCKVLRYHDPIKASQVANHPSHLVIRARLSIYRYMYHPTTVG